MHNCNTQKLMVDRNFLNSGVGVQGGRVGRVEKIALNSPEAKAEGPPRQHSCQNKN